MSGVTSYTADRMSELADKLADDESVPTGLRIAMCEVLRATGQAAYQRHEMSDMQREILAAVRDTSSQMRTLGDKVSRLESDFDKLTTGRVAEVERMVRDLDLRLTEARSQADKDKAVLEAKLTEAKAQADKDKAVLEAKVSTLKWVLTGVIASIPPIAGGALWFFSRVH